MTTLTLHISPWLAMIVIWPYVSCCYGLTIGIKLSHSEEDAGAVSDLRLAGNADHTFIKTELEYVTKQVFSVDRQKSGAMITKALQSIARRYMHLGPPPTPTPRSPCPFPGTDVESALTPLLQTFGKYC